MSAELLLQEFERMADAPDAIRRLRQFVLDLAVRGRLVPQLAGDEPAYELVQHLGAVRTARASRVRRTSRTILEIPIDSLPFTVPESWEWAPLVELCDVTYGFAFDSSHFGPRGTGLPLVRIRDISSTDTEAYFSAPFDARYLVQPGDYLAGMDGDFNVRRWEGPEALLNQRVMRMSSWKLGVPPDWPRIPLQAILDHLHTSTSQTTVKHLSAKQVNGIQLPLPPLAEQHRIVTKVDELMALCDQLEAAQKEREAWRDGLRIASLHRLTASDGDGAPSVADVRFFLDRSPRLITKPEHMAGVRQATLELAVRGRLVRQDSTDEPAAEVLLRIPVPARKRGSAPSGHAGDHGATLFEVPMGWEWTYFGRLISRSDAGWSPMTEVFARDGDAWAVLKVSAVSWDAFRPEENKQLLTGVAPRLDAQVHSGDFLISRANTSELVAKAVIVQDPPRNLMLSDKIVRLELVADCVPRYLLLINNHAEYARVYYAQKASGASPSMKNVSREVIYSLPIPLPPIAEQDRIVAKVDQLMAVCDELEAALASTQDGRGRLLEALLHEALEHAAVPVSVEVAAG